MIRRRCAALAVRYALASLLYIGVKTPEQRRTRDDLDDNVEAKAHECDAARDQPRSNGDHAFETLQPMVACSSSLPWRIRDCRSITSEVIPPPRPSAGLLRHVAAASAPADDERKRRTWGGRAM